MIENLKSASKLSSMLKMFKSHRIHFSITFISLLFFFSIFSIANYLSEKTYIIYISIFVLIFIANLWLLLLTFPRTAKRTDALSHIFIRNRIIKNTNLIGAEIGVYQGDYSEQIFNYFKKKFNLKFYLIDQWLINDDFKERPKPYIGYSSQELELAYEQVKKRFRNNKSIEIMRTESLKASLKFSDNHFDFVYIDANHDYEFVLKDLKTWFPKVKSKGILFGDDYNRPYGVGKALAEFAYENKIIVHFSDNHSQFYLIKD